MRIQKLSSALAISIVFHIIIAIIAGFHLGTQELHFKNLVKAEMVLLPQSPKPKVRKPVVTPVIKPTAPMRRVFVAASNSSPQARMLSAPSRSSITAVVEQSQPMLHGPEKSSARRAPGILPLSQVGASRSPQIVLNPPNGAAYDDVFFKDSGTNPFIDTEDDPFSTFGMDVDTASYTVMRRFLRDERLPPPEAVRVEEFINTFDYNYTPPANEAFAIHLEGAPSKFGEGKRLQLLRIGIQGRIIPDTDRKDAVLTFVIDVSGSMRMENRLELVKRALTLLVEQLRPEDKIGIVVYGSDARVILPHTSIVNREYISAAIHALAPEGATNAEAGLRVGYKLALQNSKPNSINRVILCSDGVANVGQTGSEAILKEIRTYVNEGVTLTTVGFGMGNYNDILMEELANNGNGSYAYVDTLNEAKRIFVENLTGTLQVIAKDAKIQVEFNPETVSRFRLLGYENRRLAHEDFRDDTVDAGEVGAGHSVTALYEIKLHENAEGKLATVSIRHENPDTGNVTEVNRSISTDTLKGSFEETTPAFQLAASVAEFAEILRGSFWAQEGSLEIVRETLEGVLTKTREHSERNAELLSLVRKAQRFKEHQKEG
ncbi:hypothetical protein C6496_05305 [Candidatus Poribacteria bacterium]|nr:MAG: hypothetical protein C6496_05305 [Candidatus Poribacteria bacterium]